MPFLEQGHTLQNRSKNPLQHGQIVADRPIIDALTGLRGLAAAWIVLYHFYNEWGVLFPSLYHIWPLVHHGALAVDLFFMLSGFVLCYNYLDRFRTPRWVDIKHFWFMRLARIYPVHLFALLIVLVMVLGSHRPDGHGAGYTPVDFARNLLLVHAWEPRLFLSWNYPSWSISCEWFAYLLFPLICLGMNRLPRRWMLIAFAIAALLVAELISVDQWLRIIPYRELLRVVSEFALGCLLFQLGRGQAGRRRWLELAVLLSAVLAVVVPFYTPHPSHALLICFAVLVYGLGKSQDRYVAFLRTTPLLFLGEISYSLYMTHAVAQKVLFSILPTHHFATGSWATRATVLGIYLTVVALAAIATTYLIERPARNKLRKLIREPKAPDLAHEHVSPPRRATGLAGADEYPLTA